MKSNENSVVDFYAGRSVFVTGGTGFVGKVFIEKLLYHCKDISRIYLLIRNKKNKTCKERLEQILSQPVFERLRKSRPESFGKIVAVSGDVTLPQLGIEPEIAETIQKEVSLVFHTAATVKFNDNLKCLLNTNVEGTRRAIEFSKKVHDLKAFVYVSTAYSQSQDKVVYERVYPSPGSTEDLYQYVDLYDEDPVKYGHVLYGRPNSYTQTKALAESLVANSKYEDKLPVIILRPSIITPVCTEPLPGWVDNFYGATAYAAFICKGINHVMYGHPNNVIDLIPVDYVANAIIVAAAKYPSLDQNVPVYNICTSSSNPLKLKEAVDAYVTNGRRLELNDLPSFTTTTDSKILYWLIHLITELLPAWLVDSWLWITNGKQWYRNSLKIMALQRKVQDPFSFGTWTMETRNTERLALSLSAHDKQMFEFHPQTIMWTDYMYTYVMGIKRFLFKINDKI